MKKNPTQTNNMLHGECQEAGAINRVLLLKVISSREKLSLTVQDPIAHTAPTQCPAPLAEV